MAEFQDFRQQLQDARAQKAKASADLSAARENLKQAQAGQSALDRVFDPKNPAHVQRRQSLQDQRARAEAALKESQAAVDRLSAIEQRVILDFAKFTDPRDGVANLNDRFPILLLPVRLETRFKTMNANVAGRPTAGIAVPAAGAQHQLWVRVYPDDCSLDGFEQTLSNTEIDNARTYWTSIWQAGGIEDQERGAWRALVASHGSGRSAWIVKNYLPLNARPAPKANAADIILTIPTETPLSAAEETATETFWTAFWLADGDAAKQKDARNALEAAVGVARAAEIIAQYVPTNIGATPQPPLKKKDVKVSVAPVVFPKKDAVPPKQTSWSEAAKVAALPDRFVLIAYTGTTESIFAVGNPIASPLIASPDPSASPAQQLQQKDGDLIVPDQLKWMTDFDEAVAKGMGFRIDLNATQAQQGFDRILVIGLRLSSDEKASQAELETLIQHHHYSRRGLSLVPQGTSTNNTESASSGFTSSEDADASFDDLFKQGDLFQDTPDWLEKKDGQWLADCLGIDSAILKKVHNAGGVDQIEARAMNIALWPATLGYWLETMMNPVLGQQDIDFTQSFFTDYVSGRGMVPAIRIGDQPYGILPVTAFSRMTWMNPSPLLERPFASNFLDYLVPLYKILLKVNSDWSALTWQISFAGKSGDAHQVLLDILGLNAGSVEYAQRYAESVESLYNNLNLSGLGPLLAGLIVAGLLKQGTDLLAAFGYTGADRPDMLNKFFFGQHNELKGPLIDDVPLSEVNRIRSYTLDGKNYIEWLIQAAHTSFETLRREEGFVDGKTPLALLYIFLRHALQLGYYDVSIRLHESAALFNPDQAKAARREAPFVHVKAAVAASESRYQLLYKAAPAITRNPNQLVVDYISQSLPLLLGGEELRNQLRALDHLKNAPTARLERAFAEHIDCCSYRLDSWILGLVNYQLASMRGLLNRQANTPVRGVYLGAYGWLENIRPENKVLTSVSLDPDLDKIFNRPGDPPLFADSTNEGYIHAPSLSQAVAAAVLRNGYIANATTANPETLAVNLTSERVRVALSMLEGLRNGQSLGALLGYQFERGLHDRHNLAEVDKFIYPLRKAFPLQSDRLNSTRSDPTVPIEAIEARNVMDGLAFVNYIKSLKPPVIKYPFGKALPDVDQPAQAQAIELEVTRLLESHSAVADVVLAEGVYQAVHGNYDRVAANLDAYTKGHFPPEPEVVRTPVSGAGLTHRVALHLQAGADPAVSPVAGVSMTPRAQGEPALNVWLAKILPSFDQIGCKATYLDAVTSTTQSSTVTVKNIGLQPLDLIYLLRDVDQQSMKEIDDRILQFIKTLSARPDGDIAIAYQDRGTAKFSFFEVLPLARSLRRLLLPARPLASADLAPHNDAKASQNEAVSANKQRVVLARTRMQAARDNLFALKNTLDPLLADLPTHRNDVLANIDTYAQTGVAGMADAALFGIPQAGWGFIYDWQKNEFRSILKKCADLVSRWNDQLTAFDNLITTYNALPAGTSDQDKFVLLQKAERLISTVSTIPLPATPGAFKTILLGKRTAFVAKRDQFAAIKNTKRTTFVPLNTDVKALLPVSAFDFIPLTLDDQENQAVIFAQELFSIVKSVLAGLDAKLAASQQSLTDHDAAGSASAKVKALVSAAKTLLGDDFLFIQEFSLTEDQGNELDKAVTASQNGELFQYLTATKSVDFPADDWLYGVARVRNKIQWWEQIVMFSGAFGNAEPELTPLQLPFKANDNWLAMQFPPDYKFQQDYLLYTAHFSASFDKTKRQCGLLLDEWAEVIPATDASTGLAFHYERANSEPPQTFLLVTPTAFRGAWQWADIVDALNETLEFAKKRALEPVHLDSTVYARFLPATVTAVTYNQLTISANFALNNNVLQLTRN
jgi:hypothetical protein